MREICLDTETTGMAAKEGDRIIEIGCVELGEHGLTDKNFHEYIDPERQMEAEVIRVHRSEEHTSELQSLPPISYAVFCLKKKHNDYINR